MPMPHDVQMQLIKDRLVGKEGKAKLEEIRKIESELPGFNTGPYGIIKKWLKEEIDKTKVRSKIKHQDWLGVEKQGVKQFVLVGIPSSGKSSLIKELTGLQTKVAAYEFTTLKPIPGVIDINGAQFQIVDLPGLIEGATEDVGGGKRLLGIVKGADGIILLHDLSKPFEKTYKIIKELEKSNIKKPMIIIGNKKDLDVTGQGFEVLKRNFPKERVIAVSTITQEGFKQLKEELWKVSGLIRTFPEAKEQPLILKKGSTVKDFIEKIHRNLLEKFEYAHVNGKSVKFPNQEVGLSHILEDGDVVKIKFKINKD